MSEKWHNWFAWRPVRCRSGKLVWLRRIWRRAASKVWEYHDHHDHRFIKFNTALHLRLIRRRRIKASTYKSANAALMRIRSQRV